MPDPRSLLHLSARQREFIAADRTFAEAKEALSAAKDAERAAEDAFWPAWDALTASEQEHVNEAIQDEKRAAL